MANYVKFRKGSLQAYQNLVTKDDDTLYFIIDQDDDNVQLYLGSKLISGGEISDFSIGNLQDTSIVELADKQILVYDSVRGVWVNTNYRNLIEEFVGATANSTGISGLVPAPGEGNTNLFLRSDGTWVPIEQTGSEITLTGENPISVDEKGVIKLLTDNTTIGIIEKGLSIVGFEDASIGAIPTKTENGLEWIVPEASRDEEFASAIEKLETIVGQEEYTDEDGQHTPASGLVADVSTIKKNIKDLNTAISEINIPEINGIDSNPVSVNKENNLITISHAKKGPESGFISTTESAEVNSFGSSASIKVPAFNVDEYGHVNIVEEKEFIVSIPEAPVFVDTNTQYTLEYIDETIGEGESAITKKYLQLKDNDGAISGKIDASDFIKDGMLSDVSYDADLNALTFVWNTDSGLSADTVILTDLLDPYAAGAKIVINGTEISHEEIETKDLSAGEAGTRKYVTSIETDGYGHITGYRLEDETVVDTNTTYEIAGKADSEGKVKTVVLTSSEGESTEVTLDVYTTNEVYTKSEANQKIEDYVESVTGGENAGEVLNKLENYQEAIDAEIWGADVVKDWVTTNETGEEHYAPNYEATSRIDIIKAKVDNIEEFAQVNKIDAVDSNFTIGERKTLQLNDIAIAKVSNLQDTLDSKLDKNNINENHFHYVDGKLSLLKDYEDGAQVNFIQAVDTLTFEVKSEKIGQDDDGADIFGNKLNLVSVPVAALTDALGDLTTLPNAINDMTLVDEINNIYDIISWKDI